MVALDKIEAFVLAGGKSIRMEEDKGLALLRHRPLVSYVLDALAELQIPTSLITANDTYKQFVLPMYTDTLTGLGPLGGLLTALEHARKPNIFLLGCDMPFLQSKTIQFILDHVEEGKVNACLTNGLVNPLLSIYPKTLLVAVKRQIETGKYKMQEFISGMPHHLIDLDVEHIPAVTLTNINSKEELEFWNKN